MYTRISSFSFDSWGSRETWFSFLTRISKGTSKAYSAMMTLYTFLSLVTLWPTWSYRTNKALFP